MELKDQTLNYDGKLSEEQKSAWVEYSKKTLSAEVLNGLTVNVGKSKKFVKDVIHYNSDIEVIMKNPEELIKIQIFLNKTIDSSIKITGVYDSKLQKAIDLYRKEATKEGEMANFQSRYPEFRQLVQKFPSRFEELKKRALLYKELSRVKKEIVFNSLLESENISKIQIALANNSDNETFLKQKVKTMFEGWNSSTSINYNITGSEYITYADYISRLTSKAGIVKEIFGEKKLKSDEEIDKSEKELSIRCKTFMDSLIGKNPKLNMNNKLEVDSIYKAIIKEKGYEALNLINRLVFAELSNLRVNLTTDEGLSIALRSIGDTHNSGKIMQKEIDKTLQDSSEDGIDEKKRKIYKERYSDNLGNVELSPKFSILIEKRFNEMMDSIKDDPTSEFYYLINNKTAQSQARESIISIIAFDKTMKEIGTNGLGFLANTYDDMKGINGWSNFTDENAKLTKDMSIMILSMALTSGVGLILSGVAAGSRAIQAGSLLKAAQNLDKTGKMASISRKTNILVGQGFRGVGKVFEFSAKGVDKLNKIPVVGNATIFTGIDGGIRYVFNSEGEMTSHLDDYAKSLVNNTAMFGMFHGIGKITGGIVKNLGIGGGFREFGILSSGDVAGMYVLNLIETGKYSPTTDEWIKIISQAAGFRVVMKGIEKSYPKVFEKINSFNEKNKVLIDTKGRVSLNNGKRVSTGVAEESILRKNALLSDSERIQEAQRLLGRDLTKIEANTLIEAHNIEQGKNISKGKILRGTRGNEIFTKEETRILMDNGIAGDYGLSRLRGTFDPEVRFNSKLASIESEITKFESEINRLSQQIEQIPPGTESKININGVDYIIFRQKMLTLGDSNNLTISSSGKTISTNKIDFLNNIFNVNGLKQNHIAISKLKLHLLNIMSGKGNVTDNRYDFNFEGKNYTFMFRADGKYSLTYQNIDGKIVTDVFDKISGIMNQKTGLLTNGNNLGLLENPLDYSPILPTTIIQQQELPQEIGKLTKSTRYNYTPSVRKRNLKGEGERKGEGEISEDDFNFFFDRTIPEATPETIIPEMPAVFRRSRNSNRSTLDNTNLLPEIIPELTPAEELPAVIRRIRDNRIIGNNSTDLPLEAIPETELPAVIRRPRDRASSTTTEQLEVFYDGPIVRDSHTIEFKLSEGTYDNVNGFSGKGKIKSNNDEYYEEGLFENDKLIKGVKHFSSDSYVYYEGGVEFGRFRGTIDQDLNPIEGIYTNNDGVVSFYEGGKVLTGKKEIISKLKSNWDSLNKIDKIALGIVGVFVLALIGEIVYYVQINNKTGEMTFTPADTGAGEGVQRGTGEGVQRGAGEEVQRGAGEGVQRGTGEEVQRGTGEEVQRGTGEGVQRGAGEEVQRGAGEEAKGLKVEGAQRGAEKVEKTSGNIIQPWVKTQLDAEGIDLNNFGLDKALVILKKFNSKSLFKKGHELPKNISALIYGIQFIFNGFLGLGNLKQDGLLGTNTMNSISKYQKSKGINSDGIPGYDTISSIIKDLEGN